MGDRVARRLVASHRQQEEEQVEVHVGQVIAVDLGLEQLGDDVVLRRGPVLVGELLGVHEHLDLRGLHLLFADDVLRVFGAHHPVRPLEDLVAVLAGHADQFGDDLEGQLGCDVDHEVDVALGDGLVDDVAGEVADVLFEHADHARREPAVHQLAVPRVLGRVHHQHELRPGLLELGRLALLEPDHSTAVGV